MAMRLAHRKVAKRSGGGARPGAGRPKGAVNRIKLELAEVAREHTAEALESIVRAMRRLDRIVCDHEASPKTAIAAAAAQVHVVNLLFERGYGRPSQAIHVDAPAGAIIAPILNVFASESVRPEDRPVSPPQAAPRAYVNGH